MCMCKFHLFTTSRLLKIDALFNYDKFLLHFARKLRSALNLQHQIHGYKKYFSKFIFILLIFWLSLPIILCCLWNPVNVTCTAP